jgi:hypothetical protein
MVRLGDLRTWVTVGNGDQVASPSWLSERRAERILYPILMPVVLVFTVLQRLLRNPVAATALTSSSATVAADCHRNGHDTSRRHQAGRPAGPCAVPLRKG